MQSRQGFKLCNREFAEGSVVLKKSSPVTKGRKFKQVLEGARKIFLRDGFEGASVDDISREAGVSKATLYSYFPDKELMFSEVFRSEIAPGQDDAVIVVSPDRSPAAALPRLLQEIAGRLVSGKGVRTYRMGVAESSRFPELAHEYYEAMPKRLRSDVRVYLEGWVRRGELNIDDVDLAAEQLISLATALIHDRAVFLGSDQVPDAMIRRVCDGATRMFLAAYGPASSYGKISAHHNPLSRAERSKTVPPLG